MPSGILGRLGNVGQVLLEQRLKDEEADKNRDALYAQQASLSRQGLFNNLAEKLSTKVLAGEADVSKLSPDMQALLADAGAAAPTDQMKTGALIGEWGRAESPDRLPSREEQIAAMQAKGMKVNTNGMEFDPLKRTQFSDENGTIGGSEEGLLPAYTRGAEQENPFLTQSSTAVGAAKGRLQQGIEDTSARKLKDAAAEKLLPGRPGTVGYLQLDQHKRPLGQYVLGADGQTHPATAEDMANPDIKWSIESEAAPAFGFTTLENNKEQARAIYAGIKAGTVAPDPVGLSRQGLWGEVSALAANDPDKFNLMQASQDWKATQAAVRSMNSTQMQRLGQTIQTTARMSDLIDTDADAWNGMSLGPLNRATLAAARQGLMGKQAQDLAVHLSGQIADVTADMAVVYRNGNSPTEDTTALAAKNIEEWWATDTIHGMTKRIRQNLDIRKGAMNEQQPMAPGGWVPPGPQQQQQNTNETPEQRYQRLMNQAGGQ